jgi:hypothetical protein
MQSFERQAGNRYGTSVEPLYATLSYTWGRFQKADQETLNVKGITWKTPSIDPDHFTASQLRQVLQTIADVSNVEYVWLDIACLHMENLDFGDPERHMQPDIFFGADFGFAWLSETCTQSLVETASAIESVRVMQTSANLGVTKQDESVLDRLWDGIRRNLTRILEDPWLSSLWTLLEAAVNPDAILLSSDGSAVHVSKEVHQIAEKPKEVQVIDETGLEFSLPRCSDTTLLEPPRRGHLMTGEHLTLQDLVFLTDMAISQSTQRERLQPVDTSSPNDLIRAVHKTGLSSLTPFNLLCLYTSIQYRHEMHAGDRLRYIYTEIFGFPATLNARNETRSTTTSLEAEFKSCLIKQFPAISQLYLRVRPPALTGSPWLLTADCEIPDLELFLTCFSDFTCMYSVTGTSRLANSAFEFRGKTYDFASVARSWITQEKQTGRLLGISIDAGSHTLSSGRRVDLAHMRALPRRTTAHLHNRQTWTVSRACQKECLEQISLLPGEEDIRILLLVCGKGPTCSLAIGVIIVPCRSAESAREVWRRIGICFWLYEPPTEYGMHGVDCEGALRSALTSWRDTIGVLG